MRQIVIYALLITFTLSASWLYFGRHDYDLTRCQRAVIIAQREGLQGINFTKFVGEQNECVLDAQTGQWFPE